MVHVSELSEIVTKVDDSSLKCGGTKLITIDGPAGSGKTTLAISLSKLFNDCPVIQMDEIYEGWQSALTTKTSQDLVNWIINPLLEQSVIVFNRYDWALGKRLGQVVINYPNVLIIEGVGSSVIEVSKYACLKLWIEVSPEIGINRVLDRDGQDIQAHMESWQTQEKNYFIENKTKENSDIWIDGDPVVGIDTSSQFVRTNR